MAIVFGIIGLKRSAKTNKGKDISTAGLVFGIISIALIISVSLFKVIVSGVNHLQV